ncbi:MAG: pentapeptide repeat-containing protein [bacterium]|nr:pentapeptide repeat-containing protein [bacterium]
MISNDQNIKALIKLIECIVKEVNFSEAELSESIFTKSDFSKSIFAHTNLTKCDFRQAFDYEIDFNFNNIKKAKFSLPEASTLLKSLEIILEE